MKNSIRFCWIRAYRVNGDGWMLRISKAALVEAHVQSCPVCASKKAETRRLEDGLDQLRLSTDAHGGTVLG